MKKSLIFVGILAIGYANAQEYDGKVGINTDVPSATLNVKSQTGTTANTKNLELENANGTKLLTVLDNAKVGIATPTPTSLLTLRSIGNAYGDNAIQLLTYRDGVASGGGFDIYRYRGAVGAHQPVQTGDELGSIGFFGHSGTGNRSAYKIMSIVSGNVTGPAIEGSVVFRRTEGGKQLDVMTVHHTNTVGIGVDTPTEKLDVNGTARLRSLSGSGDRAVYADENGVLKVGAATTASTGATTLAGENNLACNDANRGKMNFVKDVTIGSGTGDAFAVCLKGTDGKFYWRYLYGASGVTNSTENFGTGLQ